MLKKIFLMFIFIIFSQNIFSLDKDIIVRDLVCVIIWTVAEVCVIDGAWGPKGIECHTQYYIDDIICFEVDGGGDGGGGGGGSGNPSGDINGNGVLDDWKQVVQTSDPCRNNIKSSEDLGSNYGGRNEQRPKHNGVDVQCDNGDPLLSLCTGTVISESFAEPEEGDPDGTIYNTTCGNGITIKCAGNLRTFSYCHMKERSHLSVNDSINAGDTLGKCDNTGNSFGDHVHVTFTDSSGNKDEYYNHTDNSPSSSELRDDGC